MNTPLYINANGRLMDLSEPQVMGILNVTPDSFYAGSRSETEKDIIHRLHQILDEGASIIDMGAYSSRPDAEHISAKEEISSGLTDVRLESEVLSDKHNSYGEADEYHGFSYGVYGDEIIKVFENNKEQKVGDGEDRCDDLHGKIFLLRSDPAYKEVDCCNETGHTRSRENGAGGILHPFSVI